MDVQASTSTLKASSPTGFDVIRSRKSGFSGTLRFILYNPLRVQEVGSESSELPLGNLHLAFPLHLNLVACLHCSNDSALVHQHVRIGLQADGRTDGKPKRSARAPHDDGSSRRKKVETDPRRWTEAAGLHALFSRYRCTCILRVSSLQDIEKSVSRGGETSDSQRPPQGFLILHTCEWLAHQSHASEDRAKEKSGRHRGEISGDVFWHQEEEFLVVSVPTCLSIRNDRSSGTANIACGTLREEKPLCLSATHYISLALSSYPTA